MRSRARVCSSTDCGRIAPAGGLCPECLSAARRKADRRRPSPAARGYGERWRRVRAEFLRSHPLCLDCGAPATVADHSPRSRVELLRSGVADPDDWRYLQPRCARCHNRRTAQQDRGFGREPV